MVAEHVEDEAFLDGLLHGVAVERQVLDSAVRLRIRFAEQFEGLVLWCGREGEIAGVVEQAAVFDDVVDLVLERVFVIVVGLAAQRDVHGSGGASALAGVGFVDDDGEFYGRDVHS